MKKGTKKLNNNHAMGNGNGKFGKKEIRIDNSSSRPARTVAERLVKAGAKEKARLSLH